MITSDIRRSQKHFLLVEARDENEREVAAPAHTTCTFTSESTIKPWFHKLSKHRHIKRMKAGHKATFARAVTCSFASFVPTTASNDQLLLSLLELLVLMLASQVKTTRKTRS